MSKEFKELSTSDVLKLDKADQTQYFKELDEQRAREKKEKDDLLAGMSADILSLKKANGKLRNGGGSDETSYTTIIRKLITDNYESIKGLAEGEGYRIGSANKEEYKSMITSTALTGSIYSNNVVQSAIRPYFQTHIRDVLPIFPSSTGQVIYPQEAPTLTVAGSGSFGTPGQGNTKPVIDYALKTVTLPLNYIAGMSRVAREMLQDLPWLLSYLGNSLVEDFKQAEDAAYLPLLISGALSGSTSETLPAAKALDYFAQVWGVGRKVSAALVSPSGLVNILKTKPNDYSIPGGTTYDAAGNVQVMGVSLIPCPFMTGSTILAGNFAGGAGIAVADDLNLRTTEFDGNNFSQNMVSFRMEAREGLMILSPKSFVYGTI